MIDHRAKLHLVLAQLLFFGSAALADQHFSDEVFFDNSHAPDVYFYSSGQSSGDSRIALVGGKLPVTTAHFISASQRASSGLDFGEGRQLVGRDQQLSLAQPATPAGRGRRFMPGRGATSRSPRAICPSWRWSTP